MKKSILIFAAVVLAAFIQQSIIDEMVGAFKTGNSSKLALYFDNVVAVTLPDKSDSYSKTQAETIIRDFFANNPVKGFDVMHKGDNNGSQFFIGTLQTKNGSYRTTVFLKQKGERQFLQEIKLESK
jgi:hypothetical protein